MRRLHFESLQPVCPTCCDRTNGVGFPVRLGTVLREQEDSVLEGVLHCSNEACLREYPIIDGVPILVAELRSYIGDNLFGIYARNDLAGITESIIGDCCGADSWLDSMRQQLSSYGWDHYADLDSAEPREDPAPGSLLRLLEHGMRLLPDRPAGPIIDVGCGVGRTSFELAAHTGQLVLGVDLNFPMLRLAAGVLNQGKVRYPRRRVGVVYDQREFDVAFPGRESVDFWACDAAALPFADSAFTLAVGMNVIDSVRSPLELLHSLARILQPHGHALLACPYDWSAAVTPIEQWLGGHSQRGPTAGSSADMLQMLLTPGGHPAAVAGLELRAQHDRLPWYVRMHERSIVHYQSQLLLAEAVPCKPCVSE